MTTATVIPAIAQSVQSVESGDVLAWAARRIAPSIHWIASKLKVNESLVNVAVDELVSRGLVERWERKSSRSYTGMCVCLTPLAQHQLGLKIVTKRGRTLGVWVGADESVPADRITQNSAAKYADLANVIDDRAEDPATSAQRNEQLVSDPDWELSRRPRKPVKRDGYPAPLEMLWDTEPSEGRPAKRARKGEKACPGCWGDTLPTRTYCLRCDRYGMDGEMKLAKRRKKKW